MIPLIPTQANYDKFVENTGKLGWEIEWPKENILDISKSPEDIDLRGRLRIEYLGYRKYKVYGILDAPNIETLVGVSAIIHERELLTYLNRAIYSWMEPYFSVLFTNNPEIRKAHNKYVIGAK